MTTPSTVENRKASLEVLTRAWSDRAAEKDTLQLGLVCSLTKGVITIQAHEKQRGSAGND